MPDTPADPSAESVHRLADVVTELTDAVQRLSSLLTKPEHHEVVRQLTDERFRTVTR